MQSNILVNYQVFISVHCGKHKTELAKTFYRRKMGLEMLVLVEGDDILKLD
jgi:hypothetical protein